MHLSRPTVYRYLDIYMNGGELKEPYMTMFNAFFSNERSKMQQRYKCLNGNIIVKLVENTASNANGTFIKNSETRGKRDIVVGQIVECGNTDIKKTDLLYFSFYAAQPLILDDVQVYVVNYQDIKFIKKGE